jgi:hypothetical protein
MKLRSWLLWVLTFFLVAFAAAYQRMTGPTYPMRSSVTIGGSELHLLLLRSSGSPGDEEIRLSVPDTKIGGFMELRRFRSNDPVTRQELERQGNDLVGRIPHQPPAGKVAYRICLSDGTQQVWLTAEPVIVRFKGNVPPVIMIPHILLMFLAMLFSTRAGFEALLKRPNTARLALWTTITFGLGGIVLGPIVQKIAFGAFWTGWPFGHDLTDDKTAAAFLLWVVALWRLHRNPNARGWALAASVVLFAIYMIPHSVLGSELDYTQMPPPKG